MRSRQIRELWAFLLIVGLAVAATPAYACGPNDLAAVASAREELRASCDCAGAASPEAYLDCAETVVDRVIAEARLVSSCKQSLLDFAALSTCGRENTIGCCVLPEGGTWEPILVEGADDCHTAPQLDGVTRCRAWFDHLEYACGAASCINSRCGDGILDSKRGEECEPPGEGLCSPSCRTIICGNGQIDEGEDCEPPNTPTCDFACGTKNCGDGEIDRRNEECEPPGTRSCTDLCYFPRECGDLVVDRLEGEECEPPGTAICDAQCLYVHECGNGVVEPGEECDGQPGCNASCQLSQRLCCETGFGCWESSVGSGFDAYWFSKSCYQGVGGSALYGACSGTAPCPSPVPEGLGCRVGSCVDEPIEPLELCCEHPDGTCTDIVARTSVEAGSFACVPFPPPERGPIARRVVGKCDAGGRCRSKATAIGRLQNAPWLKGNRSGDPRPKVRRLMQRRSATTGR